VNSDDASATDSAGPLPNGFVLNGFVIRGVLGEGGFSIVYEAWDPKVEREVAIKEYMPTSLATRSATQHVTLLSRAHRETFEVGLRSFVNEARLLGRLDHECLVKVYQFWEDNGTAYMAMPRYRARTVKAVRDALQQPPDEPWLRSVLEPVLSVLEYLHSQGIYHRDIAPDNIMLRDDGRPLVLDFGAARRVIGEHSQILTAILKPRFAPVEQYAESPGLRQGPWTDLYALGATMRYLITGQPPMAATARVMGDDDPPLASLQFPGIGRRFLRAIDEMLIPQPQKRPASVAAVRALLAPGADAEDSGDDVSTVMLPTPPARARSAVQRAVEAESSAGTAVQSAPVPSQGSRLRMPLIGAGVVGVLVLAAVFWWVAGQKVRGGDPVRAVKAASAPSRTAAATPPRLPAPVQPATPAPIQPAPAVVPVQPAPAAPKPPPPVELPSARSSAGAASASGAPPLPTAAATPWPVQLPRPAASAPKTQPPPTTAAASSPSDGPTVRRAAEAASAPQRPGATTAPTPDRPVAAATDTQRPTAADRSRSTAQVGSAAASQPADGRQARRSRDETAAASQRPGPESKGPPSRSETTAAMPAREPATVATPEPTVASPLNPYDACGGRIFIALDNCLRKHCAMTTYARHQECARVRGICELPNHVRTEDCQQVRATWRSLSR
jgi:serine/threonine protein kinase